MTVSFDILYLSLHMCDIYASDLFFFTFKKFFYPKLIKCMLHL